MEEETELIPAPGFHSVFSNSLVWRTLGQCLNFSDLKDVRLACSNFNQKVLSETNFKKRAIVNLNQDRLKQNVFGTTPVLWKNFKVRLYCLEDEETNPEQKDKRNTEEANLVDNEMEWLYPLLDAAESLSLFAHTKNIFAPVQRHYPSLVRLLEAPVNLQKLALDVNILDKSEHAIVFNNLPDQARLILENLVEFHILSPGFRALSHDSDSCFVDSTGMLATVMKNLKIVKVDDIVDEGVDGLPDSVDDQVHMQLQNLLGIVEQNKNKITKLYLDDMELWSTSNSTYLQSLTKKVFPSLTNILIRIHQNEMKNLMNFLKKQPLLEEIDLTVLSQFPNELLTTIRERSKNLRRLRIKTKGFEKPETDMWNFLGKLEALEDIQLDFRFSNRFSPNMESPSIIFINLPASIKRISLSGFPYMENEHLTAPVFEHINPSIVTKLSIKKCNDVVNDTTLEYIFKNFKMLQIFEISEAVSCTDFGFTGQTIDSKSESKESSFCLSDLKGDMRLKSATPSFCTDIVKLCADEWGNLRCLLQEGLYGLKSLMIKSCSKITNATCAVIAFQELVYLDLSDNELIDEEGIKIVLENHNPSLERLKTSELSDDFPMEEEISKTHPRFQTNGHVFSDGGDSDDGDDSMAHFPDGDSDFSGPGNYEGLDYDDDDYDYDYDHEFSDEEFDGEPY